jgi:hypothetical protein
MRYTGLHTLLLPVSGSNTPADLTVTATAANQPQECGAANSPAILRSAIDRGL